jgi:hypothetical protein
VEQGTDTMRAKAPVEHQDAPALEAALQRLMEAERKTRAAKDGPQRPGLMGATFFGLPMMRTPAASRP